MIQVPSDAARRVVRRATPPDFEEDLLVDVLGRVPVAQGAAQVAEDGGAVGAVDLGERVGVAAAGARSGRDRGARGSPGGPPGSGGWRSMPRDGRHVPGRPGRGSGTGSPQGRTPRARAPPAGRPSPRGRPAARMPRRRARGGPGSRRAPPRGGRAPAGGAPAARPPRPHHDALGGHGVDEGADPRGEAGGLHLDCALVEGSVELLGRGSPAGRDGAPAIPSRQSPWKGQRPGSRRPPPGRRGRARPSNTS